MANEPKPWFKFNPRDFLADPKVHRMSPAEVGAYILLLCHAWTDDGLPDDMDDLAFLAAVEPEEFRTMWGGLLGRCWHLGEDGRWRNRRLERERDDAASKSEQARANASKRKQPQAPASNGERPLAPASGGKQTLAIREAESETESESESTPLSPPKGGRAKPEPWETLLDQDPLRSDPALRHAWTEYHEHRRELGRQKRGVKPLTRASCASLLRRPSLQLAKALREAVEAGWQGVQLKNWTEWGEPINGQAPARAAPAKSFRQQERERGDAILRRYLDMPSETTEPRDIEIEARP